MIVVINSLGGLVSIQDEDLFQGSTKLNKIDLVAPFADNVIWKANFEMPDGTIKPEDLDGYLLQPSMKIVDNFNVWKLPITFPITQDYGIVTMQLRGYIGETVVCTTSIKLPIQKGVPYASNFEGLGDKDQLLQMISDLRALTNNKVDKVNYSFKPVENITQETVGIYFAYDDETEQYVSKALPQEYVEGTQYYEVLNTGRIVNIDGELSFAFIDNTTNQSMVLKIEKDKATLNEKQIATTEDLKAINIVYDNTNSKLQADNVQSATDEVNAKADGIIDNSIKIGDDKNNFVTKGAKLLDGAESAVAIGDGATAGRLSTAIGKGAKADIGGNIAIGNNSEATGSSAVAIGNGSFANANGTSLGWKSHAGSDAVALGRMAEAFAEFAVQLAMGTNTEYGTLKFRDFTIVDKDGKLKTNIGTENAPIMEIVATEKFVSSEISKLVGSAPGTLDTLEEIAKALNDNNSVVEALNSAIATKVDKNYVDSVVNNSIISVLNTEV